MLLLSCKKNEEHKTFNIDAPAKNAKLIITNNGDKQARFILQINGLSVYEPDSLAAFINSNYDNMTRAEKVWRFINDYTIHNGLISTKSWLYNPSILINSAGGSLCGFRSAAMTNILLQMGEQARSWCVGGHVVSEVLVDGKWQVYDADLGVVYYNLSNEICSFAELCADTTLITQPIGMCCISTPCDSLRATDRTLAKLYASTSDNCLFNTAYKPLLTKRSSYFVVPPKAHLVFPIPDASDTSNFALMELHLPKQWTGCIDIPFIPYDYVGNATLFYDGSVMKPAASSWTGKLEKQQQLKTIIYVQENNTGVIIRYYINPFIYCLKGKNEITIIGTGLMNIGVSVENNREGEIRDWLNRCNDNFVNWNSIITQAMFLEVPHINSNETCLDALEHLISDNPKLAENIETTKLYKGFREISQNYSDRDSSFWTQFNNPLLMTFLWQEIIKNISNEK